MPTKTDLPPTWAAVVTRARRVPTVSVNALWRALNYLCAAQLYLDDNLRLTSQLAASHVTAPPRGHWGTCPPVNLALAALAPLQQAARDQRITIVHGAGHAGPSALAMAYLTGALGQRWPAFAHSAAGLRKLVTGFPHADDLGSEITPLLPGQVYMGGQLGPALAFATGYVLDLPDRLAVALIGDGECETGAAAAAWLGARAFAGTGVHGWVLPVLLLNGLRMGDRSMLSRLSRSELVAYLAGLGYDPIITEPADVAGTRAAMAQAVCRLRRVGEPGPHPLVVVTLAKGATGPVAVAGRQIIGTPAVHKTPLRSPRHDPHELAALERWLAGYAPAELLDAEGRPTPTVAAALPPVADAGPARRSRPAVPATGKGAATEPVRTGLTFGAAVADVVTRHASVGGFRLFSPDELASNRVPLPAAGWLTEILNEELCHLWLQGYLEAGGAGLFLTYEAFAPVNTSLLQQHLKFRAASRRAGRPAVASLNYLLTSLGWNNTFTHQNPSLMSVLIETEDPTVRIYTPADPQRTAACLDAVLASQDRLNLLVADKHASASYPDETIARELARGCVVWPGWSDPGPPDLVLAAAGDVATSLLAATLESIRAAAPGAALRFVQVAELTCLGDPAVRPHALSPTEFTQRFGTDVPVLLVVPGYVNAIRGLLGSRPAAARRFLIRGYRDPGTPMSPAALRRHCGVDPASLCQAAAKLLTGSRRSRESAESP